MEVRGDKKQSAIFLSHAEFFRTYALEGLRADVKIADIIGKLQKARPTHIVLDSNETVDDAMDKMAEAKLNHVLIRHDNVHYVANQICLAACLRKCANKAAVGVKAT